jgi:exopolysaccharide production protein ExoQ
MRMSLGYQIGRANEPFRQWTWTQALSAHPVTGEQEPVWKQLLTWMLFWPLLCLIARQAPYFSGPARDAMFYSGESAGSGADYHAYLYINMAAQAAFAFAARRKIGAVLKENPLIIAGVVLVFLSALWSDAPGNSLRMGVEVCLCTLFACYLAVRMSTEHLMRLLMFMGVTSALLSIVFALALPSYGIFAGYGGGAWSGICDHKNTLGISMAFLLTPIFFTERYRRSHKLLYALLLLFLIFMSQSKGAWMYTAGMLCFVACLFLVRRLGKHETLLFGLFAICATAVLIVVVASSFDAIAPMLGKNASMSGRTDIYRQIWQSIMNSPLLGYGYGAYWFVNPEATRIGVSIGWMNIGYAENGILELALQLGFVGVAVVLLMLVRAAVQAVRLLRSPFYSPRIGWFLTILFLAALTNIDAGWLLVSDKMDWVLILISCIGIERETRRAREGSANASMARWNAATRRYAPAL